MAFIHSIAFVVQIDNIFSFTPSASGYNSLGPTPTNVTGGGGNFGMGGMGGMGGGADNHLSDDFDNMFDAARASTESGLLGDDQVLGGDGLLSHIFNLDLQQVERGTRDMDITRGSQQEQQQSQQQSQQQQPSGADPLQSVDTVMEDILRQEEQARMGSA